jgi:hypothetical protein
MSAFFGEYEITSDNNAITCDSVDGTLTVGDYYIYSATAAESLLDELTSVLTTCHGATVSYSISADGKVTLSAASTFAITVFQIYDVLGFSSPSLSGSNSYTATNALKYCWFPNYDESATLAPTDRQGGKQDLVSQSVAPDGTVYTSQIGDLTIQNLEYKYLSDAKTWNNSSDNSSLEEFWISTLSIGRKLRFFPDWPTTSPSWEYYPRLDQITDFAPKRQLPGSDTFWTYAMQLRGA